MISKNVCGIFLAYSVTASVLLTSCSQSGNKRSGTPASADEEAAGEEDAKPSPKKPAAKTPQVTINGDCTTATDSPAGVPAPSPDPGTAAPGAANLRLALADGTGTAASGPQLGAPPVVTAGPVQDSNCVANNTPTTPAPADQPPAANTPPVAPQPAVVPPAINPLTNVGGKTLEQCQAERKSWVPGIGAPSTCGDPLVNWCCSRADVVKQFPTLGSKLDAAITANEAQGLKLYHCSSAAGKYTLLFLKSDTSGLRTASINVTGATEKTPNAPACPLPTSAALGF